MDGWRKVLPALVALVGIFLCQVARAADATPEQVEAAIKKGVAYLYSQQKNGNWETTQTPPATIGQWGGLTALATYALLAAGESPQDKRIQAAIDFLHKQKMTGIYAMGIRSNVWNLIPLNATVKQSIKDDVVNLGNSAANHKPKGLYHYSLTMNNSYDLSTSQYGVLGMWALAQTGFDVPRVYWEWVDTIWKQKQRHDGGWAYNDGSKESTASMTAAGIATLFITQDYLYANAGINCQGNISSPAIEKGLEWMSKNFKKVNGGYTWYGIERIGVASGYKYFGTTDWYQHGANIFVRSQSKHGSWDSHGPIPGTSFGILFLVRGRAPVVMNKLQYTVQPKEKSGKVEEGHWNERPRDAANVTKYIALNLEKDLNWQIVNLKVDVDELHDAPILYISGNQALNFSEAEEAKLKQFMDQGGLIFGNADCGASGGRAFTQSFVKLGQKLYPYEFRELPTDHAIYTREQYPRDKWRNKPSVLGLSNGVRELMLLVPTADPARQWQLQMSGKGRDELFQLMANIFLYAVDKSNLRFKGQTYTVTADPKIKATSTLKLARIQYALNWNPEPGGWTRLAAILHNQDKVDLVVDPVQLGQGKLAGHQAAHLTGTTKFTFTDAERSELKTFVEGGGTLIVDAAGGSADFVHSAEQMLSQTFPEHAAELSQALKQDSAVYTRTGPMDIRYRSFARTALSGSMTVGRLRGMTFGNRLGVIFSREDLSTGLVGEPVDGVLGYDPDTATQLMENILLYVQNPNAAPAVKPEAKPAAKPAAK